MNYVFCVGYKQLFFALYLKNVLEKEIVIVTHSTDVIKFCKSEKITYIQIKQHSPRITSLFKLFALKKALDEVIKKVDMHREDTFFMTGKVVGYELFYLAKELSKKGNVYIVRTMRELKNFKPPRFKPIFIRGTIGKFFLKIVLDLDLMYYESNKDPRLGIDNSFLEKYGIKEYVTDLDIEGMTLEAVKKSKSNYKEYDNLIIDGGDRPGGTISFDSIRKLYKNLSELPIKFVFKKHPSPQQNKQADLYYSELLNYWDKPEELPDYIPVELFCNNIKKNVIAIFSVSLTTASQLQHLKAISMLELVDWSNESYKKEFKDYLIKESKNKIIFPKSFEELKEILLNS